MFSTFRGKVISASIGQKMNLIERAQIILRKSGFKTTGLCSLQAGKMKAFDKEEGRSTKKTTEKHMTRDLEGLLGPKLHCALAYD